MKKKHEPLGAAAAFGLLVLGPGVGALALDTSPAWAALETQTYEIPPGPVAGALRRFAEKSGAILVYDSELTRDKTTAGLTGAATINEGLARLLSGTGLSYSLAPGRKSVAIMLAQNDGVRSDAGAEALPAIDIGAESPATSGPGGGKPGLTSQNSYVVPNASTATKTDTPVMNTPINVQVITQKVLEDQQATTFAQALQNVSGVSVPGGAANNGGGTAAGIYLRGFQTREFYQDGFRVNGSAPSASGVDLVGSQQFANIGGIEVLKGPAAILYGLSEPGGIINIRTKDPQDTPQYTAQQQIGSLAFYRTSLAATGPVADNKSVLYRIDMSFEDNGAPQGLSIDRTYSRNFFVAPAVKWQIDNDNWLKLQTNYSNNILNLSPDYLPMINGSFIRIPHNINYSGYNPLFFATFNAILTGEHKFNEDWTLRSRAAFSSTDSSGGGQSAPSSQLATGSPTITVGTAYRTSLTSSWQTNQDLVGHFDLWGGKNTVLLGGDYARFTYAATVQNAPWGNDKISALYPIYPGVPVVGSASRIETYNRQDTAGLYVQEQAELPYGFHVMAGARYQYVFQWNTATASTPGFVVGPAKNSGQPFHEARVTPRFGLLWRPREWVSLYGNYTEGFAANNGTVYPGTPAPPTNATSWEAGAKFEAFDGRLRANVDYYYLLKTNLTIADPDATHICNGTAGGCSLIVGAARSTGPEVDIQGEPLPGWNVIVAYTNQDVRVAADPSSSTSASASFGEGLSGLKAGSRLPNVPRNLARLWSTYEFQDPRLTGLKIGAGYTYQGSMPIYDKNAYFPTAPLLSSVGTVDLMAAYTFTFDGMKTTAQVNARNIFNRDYAIAGYVTGRPSSLFNATGARWDYGAPFNVTAALKVEF